MELKEAIEATKIVRDSLKDFPNSYEILDTLLKGAEELQKENEKYRSGELLTANQVKSFEETTKKYYIHKEDLANIISRKRIYIPEYMGEFVAREDIESLID